MEKQKYDYLIIGAGLAGATFAHEMKNKGASCLVVDRRKVIGGNLRCENIEGITVHMHGPHIFHTNDVHIWNFVNKFAEFNRFTYMPMASFLGRLYNLPFNMNTFYQLWGVTTPEQAEQKLADERTPLPAGKDGNYSLEDYALSTVGRDIYELLIRFYTQKQWGMKCHELPASILKRLPLRMTYDNNYFNDRYQGVPIGGYNQIIEGLLQGIEVITGVDAHPDKGEFANLATKTVYTGPIDEFFDFKFGRLPYRGVEFKGELLQQQNFQGSAVINYTDDSPFTRIIEHKHFEYGRQPVTYITREYPIPAAYNDQRCYPINNSRTDLTLKRYQAAAAKRNDVIFLGRLAEYRYYDMHQVIASAWKKVNDEIMRRMMAGENLTYSSLRSV